MIGAKYTKGMRFEFREPTSGFYQALMPLPDWDARVIQRVLTTKPAKRTLWQRLLVM